MRKRLLALGLSGIMAMSLAACGGGAKPAATETPACYGGAGTERGGDRGSCGAGSGGI